MLQQMKQATIIIFLIFSFHTSGQNHPGFLSPENLKKHLFILASDSMEGRETGKKGQKLAAGYITSQFKNASLHSVSNPVDSCSYCRYFELLDNRYHWSFIISDTGYFNKKMEIWKKKKKWKKLRNAKNNEFYSGKQFFYSGPTAKSGYKKYKLIFSNDQELTGTQQADSCDAVVVRAGNSSELWNLLENYLEKSVKNLIVASLPDKSYDSLYAREKAVTGTFLIDKNNSGFYDFSILKGIKKINIQWKNKFRDMQSKYPAAKILFVKETFLCHLLKIPSLKKIGKSGNIKKEAFYFACNNRKADTLSTENIIGFIEGTKFKNEVLVIGAHYDHIGKEDTVINNGADDNASGTVALIDIANQLGEDVKTGFKPGRSILFIAFSGEEKGLYGSADYILNPLFPLGSTVMMINMDMIGRAKNDNGKIFALSFGKNKNKIKKLLRKINDEKVNLNLDFHPGLYLRLGMTFASDHRNFVVNDVTSLNFFSGLHDDYHTPKDTPEKINFIALSKTAKLIYLFLREASAADGY